jgi:sec-independent protein translocase protein TatB
MIDLGLSKMALIGVVALVVIGPERLPKVARMAGTLLGRAQRYVHDVKAEVSREIELEELKKMRTQFQEAAHNVEQNIQSGIRETEDGFNQAWHEATSGLPGTALSEETVDTRFATSRPPIAQLNGRYGRRSWGNKRNAMPQWYKRKHGVREKTLSGAARMKRHRAVAIAPRSFL